MGKLYNGGTVKISVMMAVYNEEAGVGACLESLASQSWKPEEILVVDDGSTDRTAFVVEEYVEKIRGLKLFRRGHEGIARQCNFVAKRAQGEILVRADGDMTYDQKYIERLVHPIVAGNAMAAFSDEEIVANWNNWWARAWSRTAYLPGRLRQPGRLDRANTFRAIRREEFLKRGGYKDVGYEEDVTVFGGDPLALRAKGAKCYHYNPDSLGEIFLSARWIGRGNWFVNNWWRIVWTHGVWGGLVKGLKKSWEEKDVRWLVFRLVYDWGLAVGAVERRFWGLKWK